MIFMTRKSVGIAYKPTSFAALVVDNSPNVEMQCSYVLSEILFFSSRFLFPGSTTS